VAVGPSPHPQTRVRRPHSIQIRIHLLVGLSNKGPILALDQVASGNEGMRSQLLLVGCQRISNGLLWLLGSGTGVVLGKHLNILLARGSG
jgi:hypothetical protein